MNAEEIKVKWPEVYSAIADNFGPEEFENVDSISLIEEDANANSVYEINESSDNTHYWVLSSTSDPLIFDESDEDLLWVTFGRNSMESAKLIAKHNRDFLPDWATNLNISDIPLAAIYCACANFDRSKLSIPDILKELASHCESIDCEGNYDESIFGDKVFRGSDITTILLFDDDSLYYSDGGSTEVWTNSNDYLDHYKAEIKDGWIHYET